MAPSSLGVRLGNPSAAAGPVTATFLHELHEAARNCGGHVPALLGLARELGHTLPRPQQGNTLQLWESLATLGAADLTAARVIEPHLDALAILDQAGQAGVAPKDSTWGVFAAQGPGRQLLATPVQEGWRLDGDKPWCSLADDLSHALLTARTDAGMQLFAIDLRHPGVTTAGARWGCRVCQAGVTTAGARWGCRVCQAGASCWPTLQPCQWADRAGARKGPVSRGVVWELQPSGTARRQPSQGASTDIAFPVNRIKSLCRISAAPIKRCGPPGRRSSPRRPWPTRPQRALPSSLTPWTTLPSSLRASGPPPSQPRRPS